MEEVSRWLPSVVLAVGCLGIAQALFLSGYLFTLKTGTRRANIFLGFVLLGLTIRIGKAVVLEFAGLDAWIRNFGLSGFLIAGPFLWFYGRALLRKEKEFSNREWLHLLPFVLAAAFCFVIPNNGSTLSRLFYVAIQTHLGAYLALCWILISRESGRSPADVVSWFRVITTGVTLILVLYVGIYLRFVPMYMLGATAFTLLIYIFSFVLLKKHLFVLEKYAGSAVDRNESQRILGSIETLFATEQPYLSSRITLIEVAKRLSVAPRTLSQVINENKQTNFSEFVNAYRIEQAKAILADPDSKNKKIATIAFESGFGNVTSFNVEFKSRLGQTPSQYRKLFVPAN